MINSEKVMFVRQRLQNGASIEKVRADLEASGMSSQEIENTMQNAVSSLTPDSITPKRGKGTFLKVMGVIFILLIILATAFYGYCLYTGRINVEPITTAINGWLSFVAEIFKSIFNK